MMHLEHTLMFTAYTTTLLFSHLYATFRTSHCAISALPGQGNSDIQWQQACWHTGQHGHEVCKQEKKRKIFASKKRPHTRQGSLLPSLQGSHRRALKPKLDTSSLGERKEKERARRKPETEPTGRAVGHAPVYPASRGKADNPPDPHRVYKGLQWWPTARDSG
eukprot:1143947-Pelagomonas_calceolata.AAC.1